MADRGVGGLVAVAGRVDITKRIRVPVEVTVEGRGVVDVAEEGVLGEEAAEFGIEVAGLGVVEAGFLVELVASESEAVLGGVELLWEAVITPGILGN